MKSIWKSTMGVQAFKDTMGAVGAVVLFILMFALIWAMAAGFGRPPDVDVSTLEPNPQIEAIIQQQKDLSRRMEALEQDMQEILQQLNRIMGADQVSMTAYCTCPVCCGDNADGYTAEMVPAIAGDGSRENPHLVATDPRLIPMGSMIYIQGVGHAVAADVGGAIKGHRIDLLMPSHRMALEFGRQNYRVVWYSASERLPEHSNEVLTYIKHNYTDDGWRAYRVYQYTDHWVGMGNLCEVIAWQPLPEPPEGCERDVGDA